MAYSRTAVFLDRDGVINDLILNPETGKFESPHRPEDFMPSRGAAEALRLLCQHNFLLIIVSNQPSWAKGKTSRENLAAIDRLMTEWCNKENIDLTEKYYCFHHPDSVVPELKVYCHCRKPGTLFLEEAREKYGINFSESWFIGDRVTDIECGKKMGCKTIIVKSMENVDIKTVSADYSADDLAGAVNIIIGRNK